MRLIKITFILLFFSLSSFLYFNSDPRKLDLKTDEEINSLLNELVSTKVILKKFPMFGHFEVETHTQHLTTTAGCFASSWDEIPCDLAKIRIFHYTLRSGKSDSSTAIVLNSGCDWKIKNHKVDSTEFSDISKEKGVWKEFVEDNIMRTSRFGKVTKYVTYYSEPLSKELIDSLKLDSDSKKQMEKYFGNQKIRKIRLGNNQSFTKSK